MLHLTMKHLEIGGYIQVSLHKISSYSNSRAMQIFSAILWNVTLATSLLTPLNTLWVTQNNPAIKMLGSFICMYDDGRSHPAYWNALTGWGAKTLLLRTFVLQTQSVCMGNHSASFSRLNELNVCQAAEETGGARGEGW